MGAMDVFRGFWNGAGKTAADHANAVAVAAANASAAASAAANPTVPGATPVGAGSSTPGAIPAPATGDKSPMSEFSKLWETADTDLKPVDPAFKFEIDPAKIQTATSGIDFMKGVNPELIAKATSGDTAALLQIVNQTAQTATATSAQSAAALINEALASQAAKYKTEVIPEILRQNNIRVAVREDNPIFSNPAAAPMVSMVEQQFIQKYPTASPAEIKANSQRFINEFASTVLESSGKVISDRPVAAPGERPVTNWEDWFSKN